MTMTTQSSTQQQSIEGVQTLPNAAHQFLTMRIQNQMFGIPVYKIRDIFTVQKITPIPLASKEIAGAINLRGRIVTAIDVRTRLGLPPRQDNRKSMNIAVEYDDEYYSLIVDSVGEVLTLSEKNFEQNPVTLDEPLKEISSGIYKLDNALLIILNVDQVLNLSRANNK